MDKRYCDYCGRLIGKEGKIYIAGSICPGHTLSIWQYLKYKLAPKRNSNGKD